MRRTSAGGITRLHFGHTDRGMPGTLSRLIFRELGMGWGYFSLAFHIWFFPQDFNFLSNLSVCIPSRPYILATSQEGLR
jgi:hypothetical protein